MTEHGNIKRFLFRSKRSGIPPRNALSLSPPLLLLLHRINKFRAARTPRAGSFFSHRGNLGGKLAATGGGRTLDDLPRPLAASLIHLTDTAQRWNSKCARVHKVPEKCVESARNASTRGGSGDDRPSIPPSPFLPRTCAHRYFLRGTRKTAAALLRV